MDTRTRPPQRHLGAALLTSSAGLLLLSGMTLIQLGSRPDVVRAREDAVVDGPRELPVLDRAVLARLPERLGGREIARRYVDVAVLQGPDLIQRVRDAAEKGAVTELRVRLSLVQERARFLGLARLNATCMAAERELGPGGVHHDDAIRSGAVRWWGRAVTDELVIGFSHLSNDRSLL